MATHSSIFAWRIPWTEEPGGLTFMGSQRKRWEVGAGGEEEKAVISSRSVQAGIKERTEEGGRVGTWLAKA